MSLKTSIKITLSYGIALILPQENGARPILKLSGTDIDDIHRSPGQRSNGWNIPWGDKSDWKAYNKVWDSPTDEGQWISDGWGQNENNQKISSRKVQDAKEWSWSNSAWENAGRGRAQSKKTSTPSEEKTNQNAKAWQIRQSPRSYHNSPKYSNHSAWEADAWTHDQAYLDNAWIERDTQTQGKSRSLNQGWSRNEGWGDDSYNSGRSYYGRADNDAPGLASRVPRRLNYGLQGGQKESDFQFDEKVWGGSSPQENNSFSKRARKQQYHQWTEEPGWQQDYDWSNSPRGQQSWRGFAQDQAWGANQQDQYKDDRWMNQGGYQAYGQDFPLSQPIQLQESDFKFDPILWSPSEWNPKYVSDFVDESKYNFSKQPYQAWKNPTPPSPRDQDDPWSWRSDAWDKIKAGDTLKQKVYTSYVPKSTLEEEYIDHEKQTSRPKGSKKPKKKPVSQSDDSWGWKNKGWDNEKDADTIMQRVYTSYVPKDTLEGEYIDHQKQLSSPIYQTETQWDDQPSQDRWEGAQVGRLNESDFANFDQSKWEPQLRTPSQKNLIGELVRNQEVEQNYVEAKVGIYDSLLPASEPFNWHFGPWEDENALLEQQKHSVQQWEKKGAKGKSLTPLDYKSQYDLESPENSPLGPYDRNQNVSHENVKSYPVNQTIAIDQTSPASSGSRPESWA